MATQDRPDDPHRARRPDREASVVGSLSDMGVADLVQTLEMGKKSGALRLRARTGARGTCWLRGGRVVDCELDGAPAGDEAFYRILRWREGEFAIEFGPVEREERIELPTQALLLQGMRRLDEWGRALEQLPPLEQRLEVDVARLGERLARMPDDANGLLRLFDGRRTLAQVLEAAPRDEVATADAVARLVADGILREVAGPQVEMASAPPPSSPPPPLEPGGVDWFAGPVGPAAAAPVAPFGLAPAAEAAVSAPPAPDGGGTWLEPPLAPPPAPAAVVPPRAAPGFSIPVPPPGSLPPPPSVAETLARYQVMPRTRLAGEPSRGQGPTEPAAPALASPLAVPAAAPATPAVAAATSAEVAASTVAAATTPVAAVTQAAAAETPVVAVTQAAAAATPVATAVTPAAAEEVEPARVPVPAMVPAGPALPVPEQPVVRAEQPAAPAKPAEPPAPRARPAAPQQPPPELVRRLSGTATARRRDPGSIPVHLEAERLPPVQVTPPRRSAAPYLALGAIVLAAIVGGTALTRRPVLRGAGPPTTPREVEAATPEVAPAVKAPAPVQPVATATGPAAAAPIRPAPSPEGPAAVAPDAPAARSEPPAPAPRPEPARAAAPAAAPPARPEASVTAPAPAEPDPRKLLAAADRKYAAGRYAEAAAEYRRAIALRSTPAAHVSLARALYDAHRSAEALQELEGVIAESPRDAGAWLLRGDIQQGEGRPAEAREAYQRFLELQPDGEQARLVRSILEREQ